MRVTQKQIEFQIERLNKALNRPTKPYERNEAGILNANIGCLHIDSNSPGDGVTRYRLASMANAQGGIRSLRSLACLGKAEFSSYLDGVQTGIELKEDQLRPLLKRAAALIGKAINEHAFDNMVLPNEAKIVLDAIDWILKG